MLVPPSPCHTLLTSFSYVACGPIISRGLATSTLDPFFAKVAGTASASTSVTVSFDSHLCTLLLAPIFSCGHSIAFGSLLS